MRNATSSRVSNVTTEGTKLVSTGVTRKTSNTMFDTLHLRKRQRIQNMNGTSTTSIPPVPRVPPVPTNPTIPTPVSSKTTKKLIKKEVLCDGRCGYRAFLLGAHKNFPEDVEVQKGKNPATLKFLTERRYKAAQAFLKFYQLAKSSFSFPDNFNIKKWIDNMTVDDSSRENLFIDKYTDEYLLIGFSLLYGTRIDIYDETDLKKKPITISHPFIRQEDAKTVSLCYEAICEEYGHYDLIDFTEDTEKLRLGFQTFTNSSFLEI